MTRNTVTQLVVVSVALAIFVLAMVLAFGRQPVDVYMRYDAHGNAAKLRP